METQKKLSIEKVDEYRFKIPCTEGMQVPGLIYANQKLMNDIRQDESPQQVAHVAHLPGIINYSLAMPDMHWGYGFPIGGVAAFDLDEGLFSVLLSIKGYAASLERVETIDIMKRYIDSVDKLSRTVDNM